MPEKLRPYSVIHAEAPLPMDMTRRHALVCLYALQDWECLPTTRPEPYAPGYFYNRIQGFLNGLNNVSRDTALRHMESGICLVCGAPINRAASTLDHLMPASEGGPQSLSNVLMLCRRCNSSKGTKDLLEWWLFKGYKVGDLPRTVLCLYTRIYWQYLGEERLRHEISPSTRGFLAERLTILPSDAHRIALIGAVFAACAFVHWLKAPGYHG